MKWILHSLMLVELWDDRHNQQQKMLQDIKHSLKLSGIQLDYR